jgi:hypothetical protein
MVAVFGSSVTPQVLKLKEFGFALAVAIALDATLIRLVFVSALMCLLDARNWWLPDRLAHPAAARDRLTAPGDALMPASSRSRCVSLRHFREIDIMFMVFSSILLELSICITRLMVDGVAGGWRGLLVAGRCGSARPSSRRWVRAGGPLGGA